ncbi:MAG: hypothetical protein RJA52_1002 [Bacteroidota bacterium]
MEIWRSLTQEEWLWVCFTALFIGMAKAGLNGLGMLTVPIMAAVFGGKVSSGLVLPILLTADTLAVLYYNRHTNWKIIGKLIPASFVGIIIALITGNMVNDQIFTTIIAVTIIGGLALMVFQEKFGIPTNFIYNPIFSSFFGLLGGFTTMIGNAAGPVLSVYLLSSKLPKNEFIGTTAWFFLVVNIFKLPLHFLFWNTITGKTLLINLTVIPIIVLGIVTGIFIVKKIPEKAFRYFIIGITFLIALRLFF